jgi:hypothetical protein
VTAVLLLTATVDPGACVMTARTDPQARLQDYRAALTHWFAHPPCTDIVFCENSAWPVADFQAQADAAKAAGIRFEQLSFRDPTGDPDRGKGFGEIGIIAHALAESKLLGDATHVVKATGRYVVHNAADLFALAAKTPPPDVACDLRNHLTVADARVFLASKDFLREHMLPLRATIDDRKGVFFEHALARAVHAALADGMTWAMPPAPPKLSGVGGSFGQKLWTSPGKALRWRMKRKLFGY